MSIEVEKVFTFKPGFGGVKQSVFDIKIDDELYPDGGFDIDFTEYMDGSPVLVNLTSAEYPFTQLPAYSMAHNKLKIIIVGEGGSLGEIEIGESVSAHIRALVIAAPGASFATMYGGPEE